MSSLNSSNADSQGIVYTLNSPNTGEATITGKTSSLAANVVIPSEVTKDGNAYNVVAIADQVFSNDTTITTLTIGANIRTIGWMAFYHTALTSVLFLSNFDTTLNGDGNANGYINLFYNARFQVPSNTPLSNFINLYYGENTTGWDSITSTTSFYNNGLSYTFFPFKLPQLMTTSPSSTICFPAKTPIMTNQGPVNIEEINADIHTIRNKKIVGITKTISYEKHLVRIAKHALGKNYPEKTTYISQNHAVLFQGQMFKAKDLVDDKKVTFVPYNGAILYNVLLEKHEKMQVNNLIVETLHPDHKVAQMYRYLKNIDPAHHGKYIELFNKHDREQRQQKRA